MLVIERMQEELERRNKLCDNLRLEEEGKPCNLYMEIKRLLPRDIISMAPTLESSEPTFKENLKAIVKLLQIILKNGIFEDAKYQ